MACAFAPLFAFRSYFTVNLQQSLVLHMLLRFFGERISFLVLSDLSAEKLVLQAQRWLFAKTYD